MTDEYGSDESRPDEPSPEESSPEESSPDEPSPEEASPGELSSDGSRSDDGVLDVGAGQPATGAMRRRRRRPVLIGVAVVLGLLLIAGAYLGYLTYSAKTNLESARTHANAARQAILAGDVGVAKAQAAQASSAARTAHARTRDMVFRAAAAVPYLGDPLATAGAIAGVVDDVATDVLTPTSALADTLNPETLRSGDKGINVDALAAAQPELAPIAASAARLQTRASGIDPSWLGTVANARDALVTQLVKLNRFVAGTDYAARLLPPMLGRQEPRRYFFGFQTPAESRGTGGLLGAYAVFSARGGKVTVDKLGPNSTLRAPARPINLGADFDSNYLASRPYTDSRNSNISGNFPYAAQIWMSMWQQQSGQRLDGAVAADPIALSYLLTATGPIVLPSGEQITGANVVEVTLSSSYRRFGGDNPARKAFLQEIAAQAISKVSTARGNTAGVLEALGRAVLERRLMVYSARADEQNVLRQAGLAHEVTETNRPYAEVLIGNLAGNKIDYYLRRSITYTGPECGSGPTRITTITVTLQNTVTDLTLPEYVIGGLGNPQLKLRKGTMLSEVTLLATAGSEVANMTLNGQPVLYLVGEERGHRRASAQVTTLPGKTSTVVIKMLEPTSAKGAPLVPVQPLVDKPTVQVDLPACR
ncbi:DUF4012 domain-containing protein [Williamsia sp. CHRR-6]|uniref:DUF4012 domain-containing protein n=1 Tax=Williamsia sp. CHRR-6 TaxID=2835871 RepID=UPI001BDB6B87|nr:DUF4012 domain-containing protein [Williamsia sp. CHRR-6]MBT0565915.1 DUF4012 domain-containing protein [Williamsia sp. CHRR-6]